MKFLASIVFMLSFLTFGFAQQAKNQVKKPDAVQPSQTAKTNTGTAHHPAQKPVADFGKVVPSKSTAKQSQEKQPARQLTPLDPDKVVKGKN